MTQNESTSSADYARYLELSRILGTIPMLLVESSTDALIALHLKDRDPAEAALMSEAYAIWKKWQSDVEPPPDIASFL